MSYATGAVRRSPGQVVLGRIGRAARQPTVVLGVTLVVVLGVLVVAPLLRLAIASVEGDEGAGTWSDVLASEVSRNLFYEPLGNTLVIGLLVGVGAVTLGGGMAWLVVMTDVPGRRVLGLLASIPFVIPSFAIALAWEVVFRNERIGGGVGLLEGLGIGVPDRLAWGLIPVAVTLIAHYYSLAFMLISAALTSVNAELLEAGEMAGASRRRVALGITLPVVMPAVVSSFLLAFAEGVSNFAAPALLGLPVGFYTVSSRLYGSINTGQIERGYVLALLLIGLAALILWTSSRVTGRRSFATITGKGGRRQRMSLGRWRRPALIVALLITISTTIFPGLVLVASSFARRTNSFAGGFTTHFWTGESVPGFAQGLEGVLRNPQVVGAAKTTLGLGLACALVATVLGLALGYVIVRSRATRLAGILSALSFVPFLIPGIALGAAYIAQFGRPFGPIPPLYGTFALLVVAGAAYTLPFASQSGRAAVSQVSNDLEDAATVAGAGFFRRIAAIIVPLTSRSLLAGAVLVFVKMVRDLSLMVLLVTPSTQLLSVVTFRYASEGFTQFANAITVIIAGISIGATLLARKLQGAAQPWIER